MGTQCFNLASIMSCFLNNSLLHQLVWLLFSPFWGVTLPTGDRLHSILICVVTYVHRAIQKVAPLANTVLPYLSWKSGVRFWWLCLAIVCWMLRTWRRFSAFLTKGNIVKVKLELRQCSCCFGANSLQVPLKRAEKQNGFQPGFLTTFGAISRDL